MRRLGVFSVLAFLCTAPLLAQDGPVRGIADADIRSGKTFQQQDTQDLQDDDFANPGFLWVDQGRDLYNLRNDDTSPACAACHGKDGAGLKGAAARYPAVDSESGVLMNLETRIQNCQKVYQETEPYAYESDELLAVTAYTAHLSRGRPIDVQIDGAAAPFFEAGQTYYYQRKGQLNLACNHCHELNYGQMLRGDRLSQGHGNGYPAYRFEWQRAGSLHRRLRNCDEGVRAAQFDFGSPEYVALELYLAWRAKSLTVETPAVRR